MGCGGGGGNVAAALVTYVDGNPVPILDSSCLAPRAGGFTYPANEGQRAAAAKAARQMDHYRRVRRNARRMPEVAKVVGGEDALVDLMYGDVDEFARFLEGAPVAPGMYAKCVPN